MISEISRFKWWKFRCRQKFWDWMFYKRLKIAGRIDENPAYCWSKLVDWAGCFPSGRWWAWLWPFHYDNEIESKCCSPNSGDTPWAYCGKCNQDLQIQQEGGE